MNIDVQKSLQNYAFRSFRYIDPEAGLLDHRVILFKMLEGLHTASDSSNTCFHAISGHQWGFRFSTSSANALVIFWFLFVMAAVPVGVGWYLRAVLIFISLMMSDGQHLLHVLLGRLYIASLEKCLLKPSAHF